MVKNARKKKHAVRRGPPPSKVCVCVRIIRLMFFIPLVILFLERLWFPFGGFENISGYLDVEAVAATRTAKMPLVDLTKFPTLERLTESYSWKHMCRGNMEAVKDVSVPASPADSERRIPKIIHQTAKSRCLTPAFRKNTEKWKLLGFSYYFHDDRAMNRLFQMQFPEFPHLKAVLRNCVTNGSLKADLWRYLVLWVYGGVYADFDTAPNEFNEDTISDADDAFFVVEQYHILSQWFMAVSPRHPLMYYVVQNSLLNLLEAEDTKKIGAHVMTGPHALHRAYIDFRADVGERVDRLGTGYKPVWSGKFFGTNNRTVTVVGKGENENQYVQRLAVDPIVRKIDYRKMGMTHFSKFTETKESGLSCLDAMFADATASL